LKARRSLDKKAGEIFKEKSRQSFQAAFFECEKAKLSLPFTD
jgi:hypothetical protein